MTKTSIRVPKVHIGQQCGQSMHDLCSWSGCQCGCHTHKKFRKLRNDEIFINMGSPDALQNKVHWKNRK